MRAHLAATPTLAVLAALAATTLAVARSSTPADTHARSEVIAEARTGDFRVALTAARSGGSGMPTADVSLTTFEKRDGRWLRTGTYEVRGPYFWKTVTGPRAVCRREIRTAGPGTRLGPRAVVQLLSSPSLGCGETQGYALAG